MNFILLAVVLVLAICAIELLHAPAPYVAVGIAALAIAKA